MQLIPYFNALEPIVVEEVQNQLQKLPSGIGHYINSAQVVAFALNQLPPLYCTSEKGWEVQQQRAKQKFAPQIQSAVIRGLTAVQLDPLRTADLKFNSVIYQGSKSSSMLPLLIDKLPELKLELFAQMADQFRNPLTVILISVKILEDYGTQCSEKEKLEYLRLIKQAAQQMNNLFNSFLLM
jgi:signal transduction histidine kinase